jgi:hypothetical protein
MMKRRWWTLLLPAGLVLILAAGPSPAKKPAAATPSAPDAGFVLCEGPYALCTRALCSPVPGPGPDGGLDGLLSCKCSVQSGYSVGTMKCQAPRDTPAGKQIFSRYSPMRSYVSCNNNRPWAQCLDFPCLIDADNPLQATATCTCKLNPPQGPYIATSDFYSAAACTTGIISSALVSGGDNILQFWESETHTTVTITVLNPPDAGK